MACHHQSDGPELEKCWEADIMMTSGNGNAFRIAGLVWGKPPIAALVCDAKVLMPRQCTVVVNSDATDSRSSDIYIKYLYIYLYNLLISICLSICIWYSSIGYFSVTTWKGKTCYLALFADTRLLHSQLHTCKCKSKWMHIKIYMLPLIINNLLHWKRQNIDGSAIVCVVTTLNQCFI